MWMEGVIFIWRSKMTEKIRSGGKEQKKKNVIRETDNQE